MDCTCIRQTELPGTTSLFADLVYHPDRTSQFFLPPKNSIDFPDDRRAALVSALREQNPDSPLLAKLAQPSTMAVVTGQQVGLYSGPAYTLYKALTAIKLAQDLSDAGTPAVPIFWLATEDHDFAEVDQAWMFDSQTEPHRLQSAAKPNPNQPVGSVPLGPLDFAALRKSMSGLPWTTEICERVEAAYVPGTTFGQAFGALLTSLLGSHRILQIDPLFPAVRNLAAPILAKAVAASEDLSQALLERNRALHSAGYHAQVHVETHTSLFFLLEDGKRIALRRQNGNYTGQGRTFTPEELASLAAKLSPNALLRPVIQDYIIPTHTYIGGPAELSYLAQSSVLYKHLLNRQPRAVHRSGFTVIDHHSQKLISRYALDLPAFFSGAEAVRERAARTLVPPTLGRRMEDTRAATVSAIARLKAELLHFDPTLAKSLSRSGRKIDYQMEKIAGKVARQTILRDQRAQADARQLSNLVFPHNHLQERFYSVLPLLAKHGLGLVDEIYNHVQLSCPDHQLVTI